MTKKLVLDTASTFDLEIERQPLGRILEIDGLRAVAVVGVLFGHVWGFGCGAVGLMIGPFDLNRALSVFGTGVDLFFVISGFCIYLAFISNSATLTLATYKAFIMRRALRIYPAYFAAVLFAAFVWMLQAKSFPVMQVLEHLVFVQTLVKDGNQLAAPFWSLAAEWHFYLVLPVLIAAARTFGFMRTLFAAALLSVCARAFDDAAVRSWDMQLPARLSEFVLGIAVARLFLTRQPLPWWLRGSKGAFFGFAVMLLGRILLTEQALTSEFREVVYALNSTVLACGYSMILWNVIGSDSVVAALLRSSPMQFIGRISYSFYLWHWFPGLWIAGAVFGSIGNPSYAPIVATLTALPVIAGISWCSYQLLEVPYFAGRRPRVRV